MNRNGSVAVPNFGRGFSLPGFIELAPRSRQALARARARKSGTGASRHKQQVTPAVHGAYALMSCVVYTTTYVVDVLRGQPIKLTLDYLMNAHFFRNIFLWLLQGIRRKNIK